MNKTQEITLRVFNSKQHSVTFILEPWGETYPFDPDDEFTVVVQGPMGGRPEIDVGDESVTVHG